MRIKRLLRLNLFAAITCMIASPASATPGWSATSNITRITQQTSINGVIIYTNAAVYNDNCGSAPGSYFLADEAHSPANSKYKSDLALIMAAYLKGTTVNFYVSGCSALGNAFISIVQLNE